MMVEKMQLRTTHMFYPLLMEIADFCGGIGWHEASEKAKGGQYVK